MSASAGSQAHEGALSGRERLIELLLKAQEAEGWISPETIGRAARETGASRAEVLGVASFYSRFSLRRTGRHRISVCVGTACHVAGAKELVRAYRDELRIPEGSSTDPEGCFELEEAACLGCCMLAPVVRIGERIYGRVEPSMVRETLEDFSQRAKDPGARGKGPSFRTRRERGEVRELRLCLCSSCSAAGARELWDSIELSFPHIALREVSCSGDSSIAPLLTAIMANGEVKAYSRAGPAVVRHVLARGPLDRFAARLAFGSSPQVDEVSGHYGAMGSRVEVPRFATAGSGSMEPLSLASYREHGGFSALRELQDGLDPERMLERLEASGLRGRGGAGFPTARKWRAVRDAPGPIRYAVANGDEGDPGAFMDRMLLESYPFRCLEGLVIAAICVGARRAFVYVRDEYPLALKRLDEALCAMRAEGLLALPSGGELEVEIARGAGAFVCGEETALLAALSGRRGEPSPRPPYPAERGFRGCPTLVNNVETFAAAAALLSGRHEEFGAHGTEGSRGTKTFALAGVERGGLVELPLGTTIRELLAERGAAGAKAVQIGGPSGGIVPESRFDSPVDYEALREAGAFMGSGGLVVLGRGDCLVDVARYFMEFSARESCGKCVPCRVGSRRMLELLTALCEGRAGRGDVEELKALGAFMTEASLCGLGRSAPNPVLSSLKHFEAEWAAHLKGRCPAGRCAALVRYRAGDSCLGCMRCQAACPVDAIAFDPGARPRVDDDVCVRCAACVRACPVGAMGAVDA